ncbi:MAG: alpha/beta hydrolase [Clostridium sp.]|nr:alpha/beta hydrolase [Clostridium sp.]MCM1400132.1 alpha/beta hydrolase [Clostridium sp.]MCM1460819.1 alpha/beta hydrolase [Bacteroides sp.]
MKSKTKRFLHTFFKIFIVFMLVTALINIVLFAVININHKSKLKKEKAHLNAPGTMVDVGDHKQHVMVGGDEDSKQVLVFLHSVCVVDDSIALQPLMEELKNCKYAYVDRSGYGFSEMSNTERSIENQVEETRTALKAAQVNGPYVLVAIGTAGVEAFYWEKTYPEEVASIIGIDMIYPEQFANTTTDEYCGFFDYLYMKFCAIGGHRLVKSVFPANQYGIYDERQMNTRNALIGKGNYNEDIYDEQLKMIDNAAKVTAMGIPEADMYLLYSNPMLEPYLSTDEDIQKSYNDAMAKDSETDYIGAYNQTFKNYFKDYQNVVIEEVSGYSRMYTYCPKTIAEKINDFIIKK